MPPASPCPDDAELERILRGRPSAWDTERLARHLEECGPCGDAVDRILDQEVVVDALRGADAAPRPEDQTVRGLVVRLCGLRPGGDSATAPGPASPASDDRTSPEVKSALVPAGMEEFIASLAPPQEPGEIGRLGPYGILRPLGSGGMGAVFVARQVHPHRVVALKVLQAGSRGRQRLARFHSETEIIARLQHPHIVQVYEVGEHDGLPYFTMEYLHGGSLAQKLAAAPLAPRAAAALAETLARALHFAHGRGFIHRDLKPANVLLAADGTPKVADFGLAKQLDGEPGDPAAPYRTESGAILGTPGYMAPEQAEGKEVGPAADVYALGAILYECLTGRPPFKAATVLETLEQVRSQEPVPISRLQPRVPGDLQTVCLKCLHKEPARRYGSAEALADDLGRFLRGEPIRARPVSGRERFWKWARRKPALAALLAVSALSLVSVVAGGLVHNAQLHVEVARTRKERERADAGYRAAREALDRMLRHLERRRLGEVPQLKELQRDQCADALAFYQGVLAGADDPDPAVRLDAARAYQRAGNIQTLLSRVADAGQSYGRAIDLAEALPAPQRDLPETQELLADCYSDRGLTCGHPADGERDVGKALAIRERLARAEPDDPGRQTALATSEHQLGQVLMNAHRHADAEPHVARAVAIRTQLLQEHPGREDYQEALAEDCVNLGLLCANTRREAEAVAMYAKVEALLRPLIARHPEDLRQPLALAAAEINWGLLLGGKGQAQAAVARCSEAVALAEAALQREPNHYMARGIARNAHGARAENYEALGRWVEAARDSDRVVELDDGPNRWLDRVFRAQVLARAGEHARAAAEVQALAGQSEATAEGVWELARACALAVPAAHADKKLSTAEQDALAERYAAAAVALLRRLQEQSYFKDPAQAQQLRTDADLSALRGRADFRQLVGDAAKVKPR